METLSAFGVIFIAMIGGFLGGMLSAHLFQIAQRAYDKRRWEELTSDSSNKRYKYEPYLCADSNRSNESKYD
jgi:hypothetical protein